MQTFCTFLVISDGDRSNEPQLLVIFEKIGIKCMKVASQISNKFSISFELTQRNVRITTN